MEHGNNFSPIKQLTKQEPFVLNDFSQVSVNVQMVLFTTEPCVYPSAVTSAAKPRSVLITKDANLLAKNAQVSKILEKFVLIPYQLECHHSFFKTIQSVTQATNNALIHVTLALRTKPAMEESAFSIATLVQLLNKFAMETKTAVSQLDHVANVQMDGIVMKLVQHVSIHV